MSLTSRIVIPNQLSEPEDIFSAARDVLFTDSITQSWGEPGANIIYKSPAFGPLTIRIPTHPDVEDRRGLFAHYLWNAAVIAAEAVEVASGPADKRHDPSDAIASGRPDPTWDRKHWDVRSCDTLELGAGTGLPSLIASLAGARTVTITDHPSSPAITANTIATNVQINLSAQLNSSASGAASRLSSDTASLSESQLVKEVHSSNAPRIAIHGYTWGTSTFYSPSSFGQLSNPQPAAGSFSKIIIADCLWMPSKHAAICKTILTYLADHQPDGDRNTSQAGADRSDKDQNPRSTSRIPCALVIAGYHTGVGIVSDFFTLATRPPALGSSTISDPAVTSSEGLNALQQNSLKSSFFSGETVSYDPIDYASPSDEVLEVQGKLKLLDLFEVDIHGRRREWVAESEPEPKPKPESNADQRQGQARETRDEKKKWVCCGVLVKR